MNKHAAGSVAMACGPWSLCLLLCQDSFPSGCWGGVRKQWRVLVSLLGCIAANRKGGRLNMPEFPVCVEDSYSDIPGQGR